MYSVSTQTRQRRHHSPYWIYLKTALVFFITMGLYWLYTRVQATHESLSEGSQDLSISQLAKLASASYATQTPYPINLLWPTEIVLSNKKLRVWEAFDPTFPTAYDEFFIPIIIDTNCTFSIYAQFYHLQTNQPLGTSFRINTYNHTDQRDPLVTPLVNGGFMVIWHSLFPAYGPIGCMDFPQPKSRIGEIFDQYRYDERARGIFARRYDVHGQPLEEEWRVGYFEQRPASTEALVFERAFAPLADGGSVLAWSSGYWRERQIQGHPPVPHVFADPKDPHVGLYARRYDALGAPVGDEWRVDETPEPRWNQTHYPRITTFPNSSFIIHWDWQDYSSPFLIQEPPKTAGYKLYTNADFSIDAHQPKPLQPDDLKNPKEISPLVSLFTAYYAKNIRASHASGKPGQSGPLEALQPEKKFPRL